MDRRERQAHQPAELDYDETNSRIVVVPAEHPPQQIRTSHEEYGGERHGLVENVEREVGPRDASQDVVAEDGVGDSRAEERGEPPSRDWLPQAALLG